MAFSLGPSTRVVASRDQLAAAVGDEMVILGVRDAVYYGLDDVGTRIWALVQEPRTLDEIADRLVADYDVDRSRALADLTVLVDRLADRGLLEIVPAPAR